MKTPFKKCIGIDPGKSGGVAVITDETAKVYPCPKTVKDMSMLIGVCLSDVSAYRTMVLLEKVWAFPSDARSTAFTFGTNFGQWQGILASYELEPILVPPKSWQSHFDIKKGIPKNKRKSALKQIAIDKCPGVKRITLKTCDALLIAIYGVDTYLGYKNSKPWSLPTEVEISS